MAINEIRKQKYQYAREQGFSSYEARKMRNWSWERVNLATQGEISPGSQQTARKTISDTRRETWRETSEKLDNIKKNLSDKEARNEERKLKYRQARELGYSPDEARKMRNWGLDRIKEYMVAKKPGLVVSRNDRAKNWQRWAKDNNYPLYLDRIARDFNKKEGFDETAQQVYIYAYKLYVDQEDLDTIDEEYEQYIASNYPALRARR